MKLRFEKVSDVNEDYCHMDVFYEGHRIAFMDVSVGEDKKPQFNLYERNDLLSLSHEEWNIILEKAEEFIRKEIENEDSFRKFT